MTFLKAVQQKYAQADVVRPRRVKSPRVEPKETETKVAQFAALQRVLSSKMMARVLAKLKTKANPNPKDLKDLAAFAPQILSSVLVDMKVLPKSKQGGFVRKLEAMLKK